MITKKEAVDKATAYINQGNIDLRRSFELEIEDMIKARSYNGNYNARVEIPQWAIHMYDEFESMLVDNGFRVDHDPYFMYLYIYW